MIENTLKKIQDLKYQYENAWKQIICPQRAKFDEKKLLNQNLIFKNNYYKKFDSFFVNSQKLKLKFTFFQNCKLKKNKVLTKVKYMFQYKQEQKVCLIYLHAHQSNRLEGLNLLSLCSERNYDLCLLDFQSQGESQGNQITLGIQEHQNILELLEVLKKQFKIQNIILWGRSMGAVSAILAASKLSHNFCLQGLVIDSPFDTVQSFFNNFLKYEYNIPLLLQKIIYKKICQQILQKFCIDLNIINTSYSAKNVPKTSIVHLYSQNDQFVSVEQSKKIFEQFVSKNKIFLDCKLKHNEYRNDKVHQCVFKYLDQQTQNFYSTQIAKCNDQLRFRSKSRKQTIMRKQSLKRASFNNLKNEFKIDQFSKTNQNFYKEEKNEEEMIQQLDQKHGHNISTQILSINDLNQNEKTNKITKGLKFQQNIKNQLNYQQQKSDQNIENITVLENSFQLMQRKHHRNSMRKFRQNSQKTMRQNIQPISSQQKYQIFNTGLNKRIASIKKDVSRKMQYQKYQLNNLNMNQSKQKRIVFQNLNENCEISLDGPPLDFSNLELQSLDELLGQDNSQSAKKQQDTNQIQNDIETNDQKEEHNRRKTIKLINIAKKRSTFQATTQKKQQQQNMDNKKDNKTIKLKPVDNIKKVLENCDTDLETDKVHQKAIQKNKKKKVILKTTSLFIGYNQIKSIHNCVPIFQKIMPNCFYDLQWLDLQHNQIEQLDESLNQLENLKALYLHCNFIFDLNEFLKIKDLKKLRALMIHGNPIVRIPNFRYYFIEIFPNLKKLDTVLVTNKEKDNSKVWIYQFKQKRLPHYDINIQSVI